MRLRPLVVLLALFATACGGSTDSGADTPSSASGDSAGVVTVDTRFGPVQVEGTPKRVVALGWSDAEAALALGVQPVGVSDWMAFGGKGVGPWAESLYTETPQILGTMELDYEAVAALQPDLILNTRSDNDQAKHDKLSQIAPTIGAPKDVVTYGTTWQQQIEMVGKALGKDAEAKKITEDLNAKFAANKKFDGKSAVVGSYFDGKFGAYVSGDARVDFLKAIGFTPKAEVESLATGTFFVDVSAEQLNLFDADFTVIFPIGADTAPIKQHPVLSGIPSAKDGRMLVMEDKTLVSAFSSGSTLGVAHALDKAVPQFQEILKVG
ncbi:iron-siderophore ABC transporter substrate-binding protein [Actinosynnema pretiosum subsp. pretiosum]|uniref:Periplasmic binding protein n=2 Tax=Actinosynnema TaxID=40566 RepID=C6WF39_ACTMD|nr:iron-siderophore ABC transporter substrate-binding protein [Actinosynnema mirum]ACU34171.1 periplasmic binding protein [Actinosynnema mirum DSM 43827]AXX27544.1 ABC-type Fe3+-hydroxamate transport system, periplasmic component [Actinosynnema pretiosum subsp. pretiosum]QUF01745.1 iron-siderophore ABC transporter substrate-binding protein [Actinosynnema pretiosum subsp. pretiosum]